MRREHLLRKIRKYNGGEVGGGYEGSFLTTADIDGDWREEVLTTAEGQLRIYSTDIPAMDRRPSLMQDRFYRMAVATASCGYHYDPMPEILPSTNSPDVVLTLKKPDLLQMSVTSPMHSALQGNLKLELPEGIQCSFASEDIKLEKGSLWNKTVKLSGPGVGKCGKIYAHLKLDNGKTLTARTLSGQQPLPKHNVKLRGYWCGAETIKSQSGGKAVIYTTESAHNKCIFAWKTPGHKITWQLNVNRAGKYRIEFRYATKRNNVKRLLEVNGKSYGIVRFLPTEAMGKGALDWTLFSPELVLDLPAGVQTVSMECISGALSLDAFSFIRCEEMEALKR